MYDPAPEESAKYLTDKCSAEAGDCREEVPPPDTRPARSVWAIYWDLFTAIVADRKSSGERHGTFDS
jgi:hypothetical protein